MYRIINLIHRCLAAVSIPRDLSSSNGCRTIEGLYTLTLCAACGKTVAENLAKCHDCDTTDDLYTLIQDEDNEKGGCLSDSDAAKNDGTGDEPKPSEKDANEPPAPSNTGSGSSNAASGPVTAEEITALLMQSAPLTIRELVGKFKARLRCSEDKRAFADMLKRISKIRKTTRGTSYVILRKGLC